MNTILLSKILNYENEIFNKFIQKRTNLIKNLENLKTEKKLDKTQLLHFINDLKCVIDSVKSANNCIDEYFINYDTTFKMNNSKNENGFILFYFFFKDFFFDTSSSELSEISETELSESCSSPDSLSSSDSSSESESVSSSESE